MASIATVADTLQALLGPLAEPLAQKHRLIRRRRQFSATTLLSTFVLGYLHKPRASVADLALTAQSLGVPVTPQAVDARFQPALRDTLHDLWQEAVAQVIAARPRALELLGRFTHVLVGDSTTIQLADALADTYPGCGGAATATRAALKIQVQWDLLHGTLCRAALEPARHADTRSPAVSSPPPAGALAVYDLGYFDLDRFRAWTDHGVYWITKAFPKLTVTHDGQTHDLYDWLATRTEEVVDCPVHLGARQLPGRVLARRAPDAVAAHRRRKVTRQAGKQGRRPSRHRLAACGWTVYLTNCPADQLTAAEVEVLYRLRWQVELLFKLWKSHNRLAEHRSDDPVRQMIELFARLVAVLVQHWLVLGTGWAEVRLSLVKATRLIREWMPRVIEAVADRTRLTAVLEGLQVLIPRRCRLTSRRKRPSAPQLLENPRLQTAGPLT